MFSSIMVSTTGNVTSIDRDSRRFALDAVKKRQREFRRQRGRDPAAGDDADDKAKDKGKDSKNKDNDKDGNKDGKDGPPSTGGGGAADTAANSSNHRDGSVRGSVHALAHAQAHGGRDSSAVAGGGGGDPHQLGHLGGTLSANVVQRGSVAPGGGADADHPPAYVSEEFGGGLDAPPLVIPIPGVSTGPHATAAATAPSVTKRTGGAIAGTIAGGTGAAALSGPPVVRYAAEAIYAAELSPAARRWKYLLLPFLFVTMIGSFFSLIATFSQVVQEEVNYRTFDIVLESRVIFGSFVHPINMFRLGVCSVTGMTMFLAFYWTLRSRRVGQLVVACALWAFSIFILLAAVLDMIAVKNEQLVICEEPSIEGAETKVDCITCDELATRSNGGFYCKRTRFVFLVAMDYLFFAFLVFNGATLWGTSVRIARSQGADTTPRALLLDIAHFFINLMFPHRNPQCEYCRGRLAREALRWHMHYCTEHYESCVHCGGLVNACRLAHHERLCAHRDIPCQKVAWSRF
jgi:hypothetical protein